MNWSDLITDLQDKANMTQKEIGEEVLLSQNYISDLKTGKKGKRISHEVATALLELHSRKFPQVEAAL